MQFKDNGIFDLTTWKAIAPPLGKDKQWKDGRSAKELARYMMANYPNIPKEIEEIVSNFDRNLSEFDWDAEYVTDFEKYGLGMGNGRNHDAFLHNDKLIIGIEGKVDEPFGSQYVADAIKGCSKNKFHRIDTMIKMLFGEEVEKHKNIRYQLLTATSALLLEAKARNLSKALFLIIVFKKQGCYSEEKMQRNKSDFLNFVADLKGKRQGKYFVVPTDFGDKNGIDLYISNIEIKI